ncbi:24-hydroxycholesterol 7-alpha-hydroxylase isoform X2 [Brachyhypopomus gauderio]|uniref:24-hydroxycholesterol 7-alpha-hydroxylase isoform X2 n=1 Tax=Brachyhypopomus gauderio TaxID=698409 RepID=UPI0040425CBF
MGWVTLVLSTIVVVIFLCLCFLKNPASGPPCIRGWIPWLGAAFEFGQAPLHFIAQARARYGPVFTVLVAGKRLTFVTHHEDFRAFFMSKDVDFEQAVQESVQNTASISKESFFKFHPACIALIKARLTPGNTALLANNLCEEFNDHLDRLGTRGSGCLNNLIRNVMYPAVMSNLLGKENSPDGPMAIREFVRRFTTYDDGFEYGSQLPGMFLKEWSSSKKWLLSLLENMVIRAVDIPSNKNSAETLLQHLVSIITDKFQPNYGLLTLWASLANAIPITFWTLTFIFSNPTIYKSAMDQIHSVLRDRDKKRTRVSLDDLQEIPYVKWCVMEAIRLRAPGAVTRRVVRPLKLQNYIIPPGDFLILSPFWAHRDPRYFPDPDDFKPERWEKADFVKNVFLEGFVAFGGGKNQCPGRWYAIMELHLFITLILYQFEFTLLDQVPEPSPLHLVGTQQPERPCRVEYSHR